MIVFYVFGIPILAFIVLRNNRAELLNIETRRKYSFLYAVRHRVFNEVAIVIFILCVTL
jgi:hypothetical protein